MSFNNFELPNQSIPESQKTKKWYMEHASKMVEFIVSEPYSKKLETIRKAWRAYLCIPPAKADLTKEPYGHDLGVEYIVYPLIEGILEQLVGDYLSRPIKRKAYSINQDAINSKLDEKLAYISEEVFRDFNKELSAQMKEQGVDVDIETENPEIELPEDTEEFFAKSYKTNEEELGDVIITQFLDVLKNKEKLKFVLINYLVSGMSGCFIDVKDGHPKLLQFAFDECYYDINPEEEVQKDQDVFAHYKYYTKNEILNKYPLLSRSQLKKLDEIFERMETSNLSDADYYWGGSTADSSIYSNSADGVTYKGWCSAENHSHRIRVMNMTWKSRRQLRSKSYTDRASGKKVTKLLSLTYKEKKKDVIDRVNVETKLFIETIGPELVLDYGEISERLSKEDYQAKVLIPSSALIDRNFIRSDELRSPAAKLIELQNFASDILYEMRLMIKQNHGRVLVYDTAQIPKVFIENYKKEGALNRMMHHIKKDQILFINSKDKNSRNTFNQFTSLDLSNKGAIKDLMDGLMLVKQLAEEFTGLNQERKGEGQQYQTATNTNRNFLASNARTEVYYEPFDNLVGDILIKTLMVAKATYKSGTIINYIFGDLQTMFITVSEKFSYTDLGMYIGDSSKNFRDSSAIDQSAQQALSNANDQEVILDLISVLDKDSASEKKAVLERSVARMKKMQEAREKAEQDNNTALREEEQDKRDREDANKEKDRANNLDVAYIYADNKTINTQSKEESDMIQTAAKIEADLIKGGGSSTAGPPKSGSTKPAAKDETSNKNK